MKRDYWVDYVKVFACILVVLGHFWQSMTKSWVLPTDSVYSCAQTVLYYFHVPLFFICSGYLYQKTAARKIRPILGGTSGGPGGALADHFKYVRNKLIALGIPYAVFTLITWVMKAVFAGDINGENRGLIDTLLAHPTAPYWYLYALFFLFLVTPLIRRDSGALLLLLIAFALKVLAVLQIGTTVPVLQYILQNEIWFVMGMLLCYMGVADVDREAESQQNKPGNWRTLLCGVLLGVLFLTVSILLFVQSIPDTYLAPLLTFLACMATILIFWGVRAPNKGLDFLAKYTLPIFVMHTIFAAGIRVVLFKLGVESAAVHIPVGLVFTFGGPILAAFLMSKVKVLDALLYPGKYIGVRV